VSAAACVTCHSTSVETLTGYQIVTNYTLSVHNLKSVGCQDCHGAGGAHNGVGPIPYPKPTYTQCKSCHDSGTATSYALVTKYESSRHLVGTRDVQEPNEPCNRCHTHQGAVLAAISGFTGDGDFLEDSANAAIAPGDIAEADAEPIKCNTCHDTHKPATAAGMNLRFDGAWFPSTTVGAAVPSANAQFRLCTQCHGYTTAAGKLMGSGTPTSGPGGTGTALVGHHDTSWYRIIGTTHYDDPATVAGLATAASLIEGYVLRQNGTNPCFDCHGHEANTGTRYGRTTTPTIYSDWAQSAHAGNLLTAKYDDLVKSQAAILTV